jgi:geranylgeranyl diphosphate synthase type II
MLPSWYTDYKNLIENWIIRYLDKYFENKILSKPLNIFKNSIYYSVKWGKKIRAVLALEFYLILTWKKIDEIKIDDDIIKFCIALEVVHVYSLIHDDLPAMDNDIYRRWELTTWKKYWEANWILAWDMLNTLWFEILSELKDKEKSIMLIKMLANSIWFFWMVWWQVEDLYFENNFWELDLEKLSSFHKRKTWALIKASILGGIILSWKNELVDDFEKYAENIWLAFQIKDDILDVTWNFEETWKSVWWEKKWYIHFLWLEKSKAILNELTDKSIKILKSLENDEKLIFLTKYICERKK